MAQLGDAGETHRQAADALLRHPGGEQAAEVGHRQHAVGEHIGLARLAGEIEVDMHLVVVAGGARVQGQGGAIDGGQRERRQLVADLHIAESGKVHAWLLSAARGMSGYRRCAGRPGC
ncbi:hypothetical protein D9M71_678410 [compost metagenome]